MDGLRGGRGLGGVGKSDSPDTESLCHLAPRWTPEESTLCSSLSVDRHPFHPPVDADRLGPTAWPAGCQQVGCSSGPDLLLNCLNSSSGDEAPPSQGSYIGGRLSGIALAGSCQQWPAERPHMVSAWIRRSCLARHADNCGAVPLAHPFLGSFPAQRVRMRGK